MEALQYPKTGLNAFFPIKDERESEKDTEKGDKDKERKIILY